MFFTYISNFSRSFKASRITAFATKLFTRETLLKPLFYSTRAGGRKHTVNSITVKQITERYRSVVVKTARHDSSVAKYGKVIRKPIAEHTRSAILRFYVRPRKALSVFEMQAVAYSRSRCRLLPFTVKEPLLHKSYDIRISSAVKSAIPQSKHYEHTLATRFVRKIKARINIIKIFALASVLEAMNRYIYLVHPGIYKRVAYL